MVCMCPFREVDVFLQVNKTVYLVHPVCLKYVTNHFHLVLPESFTIYSSRNPLIIIRSVLEFYINLQ